MRITRLLALLTALAALVASGFAPERDALAACAPTVLSFAPASGIVGTSVTATVTGTGLTGAAASVFGDAGLGVSVTSASDTSVTLQLTVDAAATPGERIISLATAGGAAAVDFTVNPANGPVVTGISPRPLATQGAALGLVITGQGLAGIGPGAVSVTGNGVTVSAATAVPDGTRADISLAVAADADVGTHAIVLSTPLGGAVIGLYVQRPPPTIVSVSPGAGEVGSVVQLAITGSGLTGAALVVTSTGIAVSGVTTPDDGTLTATLTIGAGVSPDTEPRLLVVTTESGQATAEFFVAAAAVPTITTIRPAAGEPGTTVPVTIRGLNLTGASLSSSSGNVTLQNVAVVDDETITCSAVVSGGASTNVNHTITATVGMAQSQGTFRVIPTGTPFIGTVSPPFGNRGASITVRLDGVNLGTTVAGSGVSISGSKIAVSNAAATNARTATAKFDIDATANVGFRDVTVTTTGGAFTKSAGFRVNNPGQLPSITGITPSVVEPGTTTTLTVTGANLSGAGVTVGGAGAVVSSVAVAGDGASVTFDLALASDAPAESRRVLVVTQNGVASCVVTSGADLALASADLAATGAAFEVTSSGFRLFLFEFSLNDRFDAGPRTYVTASPSPRLVLSRLQNENVRRAVRDLPFGYVRVRAVTATNQVGISAPMRFRR